MDIPEGDLKSVAFLCEKIKTESSWKKVPRATAFFVVYPDEVDSNIEWAYLVTARHVLDAILSDEIFVRVNKKTEGFEDISTRRDDWIYHGKSDVALLALNRSFDSSDLAISYIPFWGFVDEDYKYRGHPFTKVQVEAGASIEIRLGLEIYFLGLFSQDFGEDQNLPIARFGAISRMPKEPIKVKGGDTVFYTHAYLAECLSFGGMSGSPVFCVQPAGILHKLKDGKEILIATNISVGVFLGLVTGHFGIPEIAKKSEHIKGEIETALNSGIAIITPAHMIRQLLEREDVVEDRSKRRKSLQDESSVK